MVMVTIVVMIVAVVDRCGYGYFGDGCVYGYGCGCGYCFGCDYGCGYHYGYHYGYYYGDIVIFWMLLLNIVRTSKRLRTLLW